MSGAAGTGSEAFTVLLYRANQGDLAARDELFRVAYPDMQRLARAFLRRAGRGFPDSATALVHRVCERFLARERIDVTGRRHFLAVFGRRMHDIMVDEYRAARAKKRGGGARRDSLESAQQATQPIPFDLIDLRDAMTALLAHDPDAAEAVNLRLFCCQSIAETAETMGCSFAVARQHTDYGIAWLRARLTR